MASYQGGLPIQDGLWDANLLGMLHPLQNYPQQSALPCELRISEHINFLESIPRCNTAWSVCILSWSFRHPVEFFLAFHLGCEAITAAGI